MPSLLPLNATLAEHATDLVAEHKLDMNLSNVDTHPLSCDARLLPYLAQAWRVDIQGLTIDEARQLIFNAPEIHKYKGTVYAVKKALGSIFEHSDITEFGTGERVFEFDARVIAKANPDSVLDATKFEVARKLINRTKNGRSRFVNFELDMPQVEAEIKTQTGATLGLGFSNELDLSTNSSIEKKTGAALALSFANQLALAASTATHITTAMSWNVTFNTLGETA